MPSSANTSQSQGNITLGTSATITSNVSVEYGNVKTHRKMDAWYFGPGKRSFRYGVASAIVGFLILVCGFVVIALRFEGRILVGSWEGEFIAPCIIIIGILLFALSASFFWHAYKKSNQERQKIRFKATGFSGVAATNQAFQTEDKKYEKKSGTYSVKAVRSPNTSYIASTGTLDSRDGRKTNTLSSQHSAMDKPGILSASSLRSLDTLERSTPKKGELGPKTPDSLKGPPKPARSMSSLDGDVKAPMAGEEDVEFEERPRSQSQFSDVEL